MAETKVTLSISTTDGANSSSTTIQTDSLGELRRMLDLAGIPDPYSYSDKEGVVGPEAEGEEVDEQETYKPSASLNVRSPDQRMTNARFADNPLEEDFEDTPANLGIEPELELNSVDPKYILDTYQDYLAISDEAEAIARTADTFGIRGEDVERVVQDAMAYETYDQVSEDFNDYNQVEPKEEPPVSKSFKDYVSDLGSEREVKHSAKSWVVKLEWLDKNYDSKFAELTIQAGTAKEAQQKAIEQAKAANGGKLNLVDSEVEEAQVSEANELTIDAKTGTVEGPMKDNLSPEEAFKYTQKYPDGVLQNDAFETYSFIFLDNNGAWKFYHSVNQKVDSWDWNTDVQDIVDSYDGDERDIDRFVNGFWYEPASDFFPQVFHKDGMAMWDEVRGGSETKQLESEVDEAFGNSKSWQKYAHTLALLPCPGMFNVDQLGDNEYFGDDLKAGKSSIVCIAIDTGDKPRLTFASTYGGASNYLPGQNVLTYHDQTGKERPGTIITSFSGKEWSTPEGREHIKSAMAKGGMDPNKKYSVRVFK
jgi:hypothetical protein